MFYLYPSGNHHSPDLIIWSTTDYSILATSSLSSPAHEIRWDTHSAYELASVGADGHIAFWLLEECEGRDGMELKVRERGRDVEVFIFVRYMYM